MRRVLGLGLCIAWGALLLGCGESSSSAEGEALSSSSISNADSLGVCTSCDSYTAAPPVLTENGGKGSVTTYGSVTAKETSQGGACNYGETNIQYYAAIHVNVESGDGKGPWQNGLACGSCVRVKASTPEGYKTVTVRITDKCPDENCGIDLGGAPAYDIMGMQVGRYYGEWEFVSCEGVEGVFGDTTAIFVKEGASAYWSIIQVRNPKDAVESISVKLNSENSEQKLSYATEAENFWTVPQSVLQSNDSVQITVNYRTGTPDSWNLAASDLTLGESLFFFTTKTR